MKYLSIAFLIILFFKSFYYGIYEIKKNNNRLAGYGVYILSFIGLLIPSIAIFLWY